VLLELAMASPASHCLDYEQMCKVMAMFLYRNKSIIHLSELRAVIIRKSRSFDTAKRQNIILV